MILDTVNKSLRAYMAGAHATTAPVFVAEYVDRSGTALTPAGNDGVLNGATPVTLVAAPAVSTAREVQSISIWNADTIPQTITVELLNTATQRTRLRFVLEVGESLLYFDNAGWIVMNRAGVPKQGGLTVNVAQFLPGVVDAANLTAVLSLATNSSFMIYLGLCPKTSTSIDLLYRITTAAVTVTWAEVGVFRGPVIFNGNPVLTRLGYTDTAGIFTSTGIKKTNVALSVAAAPGDYLWAAIGNQATTVAVTRGGLADDLQSGVLASLAATRISTVASPTTWTLAGATVVVPWIKAYVN